MQAVFVDIDRNGHNHKFTHITEFTRISRGISHKNDVKNEAETNA